MCTENFSIDIKDSFSLANIREKAPYNLFNETIIHDLQKCFLAVDSTPEVFLFKDFDGIYKSIKVSYTNEAIAKQKLSKIIVGTKEMENKIKKISAWQIYLDNTKRFTVKSLTFYSDDPNDFSYFRGYDYNVLDKVKENVIQPFLDHVREGIANGNEQVYRYILVWIASILQGPAFKTGTALVILGNEGTGKNTFFTDVICKLMARYANENVTNIEDVVGTFNAALANKKMVICNEMQSIDTNKYLNSDALKSIITDRIININEKHEPKRVMENVANFIFVSNNNTPIKLSGNDRRYLVTKTSDSHMQDFDYFGKLAKTFTPEFYENLFTFFMTLDTASTNLRIIPETQSKTDIKEASMSSYEIFARDSYHQIDNITGPELFEMYCEFVNKNRYQQCSNRTFFSNFKQFTGDSKPKSINGRQKRVYNLLPEVFKKFDEYHKKLFENITEEDEEDYLASLNK